MLQAAQHALPLRFEFADLLLHPVERFGDGRIRGTASTLEQESKDRADRQRQNNSRQKCNT